MDMPPVQYARAADGTRIAWTRLPGDSPPWLHVYSVGAPPMTMTLSVPSRRGFIDGLSGSQATVLFDSRGSGLSGPINGALTLEDLADDIAAVCDAVDEPLDAMLMNTGCFPALLHATECGRWRRVLLVSPSHTVQKSFGSPSQRLLDEDNASSYGVLWEHILRIAMDVPLDSVQPLVREVVRKVPLASWVAYQQALQDADLSATLPALKCPIFIAVGEQRNVRQPAMEVAALLSEVRLLMMGNAYHTPEAGHLLRRLLTGSPAPGSAASAPATAHTTGDLSLREIDVLRLLAAGKANKEIAATLTLSLPTVATHIRHIYEKTGSANRAEAASYAVRNGLA